MTPSQAQINPEILRWARGRLGMAIGADGIANRADKSQCLGRAFGVPWMVTFAVLGHTQANFVLSDE